MNRLQANLRFLAWIAGGTLAIVGTAYSFVDSKVSESKKEIVEQINKDKAAVEKMVDGAESRVIRRLDQLETKIDRLSYRRRNEP
jgi:uncharacterized protein Yka (UPF0111/DUF47 family)